MLSLHTLPCSWFHSLLTVYHCNVYVRILIVNCYRSSMHVYHQFHNAENSFLIIGIL